MISARLATATTLDNNVKINNISNPREALNYCFLIQHHCLRASDSVNKGLIERSATINKSCSTIFRLLSYCVVTIRCSLENTYILQALFAERIQFGFLFF